MPKLTSTSLDDIRAEILALRRPSLPWLKPTPWRIIAERYAPVPAGTLARIAYDKTYEPRRLDYRRAMGLQDAPMVKVRARLCPTCGEPHIKEARCPKALKAKPAGPRRVRYSERDTLAAMGAVVRAVVGVMYGVR